MMSQTALPVREVTSSHTSLDDMLQHRQLGWWNDFRQQRCHSAETYFHPERFWSR